MQIKRKRKHRYAAPLGSLFVILALVGLIAVVLASINLTGKVLDNSSEKEKLEDIIRPVMMFDPVPFESPTEIEPKLLLLYSMWATLSSEKSASYNYDENAELIVPASDLEMSAASLFGPDIVLEHQNFSDYGNYQTTYYYDAERHIYNVPIAAQLYVYFPQVQEIERADKDLYYVTVGYIPPSGDAWTTIFAGNMDQSADKSMVYVMRKSGNSYHIVALRDAVTDPEMSYDDTTILPEDEDEPEVPSQSSLESTEESQPADTESEPDEASSSSEDESGEGEGSASSEDADESASDGDEESADVSEEENE